MLSCSSDETSTPVAPPAPIVKYTITLSAGEGGTVSTTGGEYEEGQTVSVTATPQGEYLFKDWSDGNTNATRTITISSNSTLTANFEKKKYPLTVNIEGEGEVLEEIVNTGRTTDYDSGTTVKLTAVPAEGWEFVGWTGAIESEELEVQLLVSEAKEVNAEFNIDVNKYNIITTNRNYNNPHHITRNSKLSYINAHKVMIRNGVDWVAPDAAGVAFADWTGDGYEDFIAAVQNSECWTCVGELPQLYVYDEVLGDFVYEKIKFTSNEEEILNKIGNKIIADFDNDGDPDLLFGGYEDANYENNDKVWILENNYSVDGTFIPHDISNFIKINETATIDIDKDGDLDIFFIEQNVPNYSNKPMFLINNGNFNFSLNDSYFELIEIPEANHTFYNNGENHSILFDDINQDGYIDILWNQPSDWWDDDNESIEVKEMLIRKNKILWGSDNKYSYDRHTIIPNIQGFQLIDGIIPWDYNNDGIKEIVVVRDNGTSWKDAHSTPQGYYLQILKVSGTDLIDITNSIIDENSEVRNFGLKPVRFIDFDGDGFLSLFKMVKMFDEKGGSHKWEWNGIKVVKNDN